MQKTRGSYLDNGGQRACNRRPQACEQKYSGNRREDVETGQSDRGSLY